MSLGRFGAVFSLELARSFRRPMIWVLVALLAFLAWGLSSGDMTIRSGDNTVGGARAWITSEFSTAGMLSIVLLLFYGFFLAIAAGMAVIRDQEERVGELLHATPLSAGEYIWGKFLAAIAAFIGVLGLHILATILFNHLMPNPLSAEIRGPFVPANYLMPALVFGLPTLVFLGGIAFAVGERTRRPVLVFILPLVTLLACVFFLWEWSPTWLDPRVNRLLMLLDPAGYRWLNETWLKVDRGVQFYNTGHIGFDLPFLLSRLAFAAIGLLCVAYSQKRFAATLRGATARKGKRAAEAGGGSEAAAPLAAPLASLNMTSRAPGFWRGAWEVARVEMKELLSHPGLYLFVPIILIQTFGTAVNVSGALENPILVTPGFAAARMFNTLTLLVCLLLLFYIVESVWRDRTTGLASVIWASPTRTASLLFGKALANSLLGAAVLAAALVGCFAAVLIQGKVPFSLTPFILLWGLLMVPTFLVWTSFATAVLSLTGSRYTTYGAALGALLLSAYFQFRDKMNWVGNWDLWQAARWTDMGPLELDRQALLLNRLFVLSLTALFTALAVRFFPRRAADGVRTIHRLQPPALADGIWKLSPFLLGPIVLGMVLYVQIQRGYEGGPAEKRAKDYWMQNLATWKDAPLPTLREVEMDLTLEPEKSWLKARGSYLLVNDLEKPLPAFPLTVGPHWEHRTWTLDGQDYKPEDRTGLIVIRPPAPLPPGGSVRVGFAYDGTFPKGISRNGGRMEEFILPSGVVLTSFTPTFAPVLGYMEEMGVKKDENRYEPRVYPDDFYLGNTEPIYGSAGSFTTRIAVTVPEGYRANSVGVLAGEETKGGKRTFRWESDHPVRFFNVVAGKWAQRRGQGTAVFYHPAHTYNIDEIVTAIDASRKYYSEWFHPYPWTELKLSEFPDLARYAQGFPTNITFSEGIGFLTKSDPRTNAAFFVTAHESAHQWWGNLLTPGKGPGGNVVAEGMAQCSSAFLMEQVKGPLQAIEFRKRLEENYGDVRQADAERPLVKVDGSKEGDTPVIYHKGGWAFWMLSDLMGRAQALAGMRAFIERYKDGPDFPVIQDYLETLRPFAPDADAFDAFTKQWFHEVVVPEYKISEVKRARTDDGWTVEVKVRNDGSGTASVEVAVVRGERLLKDGSAGKDYLDARGTIALGKGEEKSVVIACAFEPDRVVVDPDARVLQLNRNKALRRF